MSLTYSGPVLSYEPQMVAEEGQNTDAEHGRHKEQEQDMEFGVSVRQLVLGEKGGKRNERDIRERMLKKKQQHTHVRDNKEGKSGPTGCTTSRHAHCNKNTNKQGTHGEAVPH